MLARTNGDLPPRHDGFGAKVSADLSEISTIFTGGKVPKRLEVSEIEKEARRVAAMVNSSEEESNACLLGLLKQTDKAMEKANAEMKAEQARQERLAKDMKQRGKETHQPGRRQGRRRRRKKGSGQDDDAGGASSNVDDNDDDYDSAYGSSDGSYLSSTGEGDDEESGRARRPLIMMPPVIQGYPDLYSVKSRNGKGEDAEDEDEEEEEEEEEEYLYDEDGEIILDQSGEPLRKMKSLGPTRDRLHRIISSKGDDDWPRVTQDDILAMMRRVRFFIEAELQEKELSNVADWVEVQTWEPFMQVAEEGTWCHSFVMLFKGTLEASGRVYRTPGASSKASKTNKGVASTTAPAAKGGKDGKEESMAASAAPEPSDSALAPDQMAPILPEPELVGQYETLAPVLLYPGAIFGEASIAGAHFPHTCSVRTITRCTLLVLRRSKLEIEVPQLPATAREGWENETGQMQRKFAAFAARWQHHNLRRLRFCKGLAPKFIHQLERICEYKIVPGGTTLYRVGEGVTHMLIVLAGTVGIYRPDDVNDDTDYNEHGEPLPPALLRKVTDASNVPLVGDAPLMMATVTEAASKPESEVYALTHTEVQMIRVPYSELARRSNLLAELRKRVSDIREQPSILMTLLQAPLSSKAAKGSPAKQPGETNAPPSGSAQNGGDQAARPAPTPSGGEVTSPSQPAQRKPPSIGDFAKHTRPSTIKIRTVAKFAAQLKPSWAADHAADHTAAEAAADAAHTAAAAGEVVAGDTSDALPMLA